MFQQTTKKHVTVKSTLRSIALGVFGVVAAISSGFTIVSQPTVYAATANTINFQARLEGAGGNIAPDGFYNVQFKLYDVSTGGTSLWTESYYDLNGVTAGLDNRVLVQNGYVSVALGSQTAFPSTIGWDQNLYLTMNIGGTTQTATPTYDGEMSPRLGLTAVPYAFRAGQLAQFNETSGFTSTLNLAMPTVGSQTFNIADQGAAGVYTLCVQGSTTGCNPGQGSSFYIQNQNASAQASSNFFISGTGTANILQAATIDSPSGTATLNIGTTNATTGINLNQNTTILSGKTLTVSGATNINVSGTANTAIGNTTGTFSVVSNGGLNVTTVGSITAGTYNTNTFTGNVLTFGSASAATISGASNQNLTVQSQGTGALTIQSGSGTVSLGTSTILTANGALTVRSTGATATSVDAGGAAAVSVGGTNANAVTIGNTANTATSSIIANTTLNLGNNANNKTINIGATGATTNTTTVNIANTSGAVQTLNLGSTNGASTTNVQGGTGNINLLTNSASSGTIVRTSTNSATAFQVQNANGSPLFLVDTTAINLLSNPGFEVNTTGWAGLGTGSIVRNTNRIHTYHGTASLQVSTTAAAAINDGATVSGFTSTVAAGTYTLTFYAKLVSGTFTTLTAGYNQGAGNVNCSVSNGTVLTTGFQRYSCTFTSTANLTSLFIGQSNASAAYSYYLDSVQLVSGTSVTPYTIGAIQLRGIVNTPAVFQSSSDSTSAFQIQNSAGTSNAFVVDTLNGRIGIGNAAPAYDLDVNGSIRATPTTNSAIFGNGTTGGITIGDAIITKTAGSGFYFGSAVNASLGFEVNGTNVISSSRVFQNVTTDASIINNGTGTLNVNRGGTGLASAAINGLLYGNGTGALQVTAAGTSGQVLIANASGVPTFTSLSGDVTVSSTGVTVIGVNKVTSAMIIDGAVTGTDIAGTTITNANIAAGAFGNITGTGALASGSISSTFGAINNGASGITSTGTISGSTINATTGLQTGGTTRIDVSGNGTFNNVTVGAGLVSKNGVNANTVTIVSGTTAANYQLTLPTSLGASGDCLKDTNGTGVLGFSSCSSTLQGGYTASVGGATAEIVLDTTRNGLTVRNAATDAITGNLLEIQNNAGTATFLGVTSTAVNLQDAQGNSALSFDSSSSILKVFENVTSPTAFASISYVGGAAIFSASTGITQIGSGSGNINLNTSNAADVTNITKSFTAAAAYSATDVSITRNIVGGTNNLQGVLLKVEDQSTIAGGALSPTLLYLNQSNASATGNLLLVQTAGTNTRLSLSTAGDLTVSGNYKQGANTGTTLSACAAGAFIQQQAVAGGIVTGGNCVSASTLTTLQQAYTNSATPADILLTSGKNFTITSPDVATDPSVLINLQCTTCSASGGRFAVQNAGSDVFLVNPDGSIRIGDATNNMTFSASTKEPTLNGSARHTRRIAMSPEYAGATITPDGTNNNGTMTSDSMTTAPFRNYYKWSNTQGTAQDYDVWLRIPLPADFSAFTPTSAICIDTHTTGVAAPRVTLSVYDTSNVAVSLTTSDLTPTANNTWENRCTSVISSGTFVANGYMNIGIKMNAPPNTGVTYIGDLTLDYFSKW